MSIIGQILYKISSYCRCRIINGADQTPYLERYHLLKLPFNYQVYLHRFVASDPGRGLHNHPWESAFALILSGKYEEIRMADTSNNYMLKTRVLSSGHFNWINGSVFHRINLIDSKEVWTLFIHGPKARSWGFLQRRKQRYAFHDHDQLITQQSNPLWWKTAVRPLDFPAMRQSANFIANENDSHKTAA